MKILKKLAASALMLSIISASLFGCSVIKSENLTEDLTQTPELQMLDLEDGESEGFVSSMNDYSWKLLKQAATSGENIAISPLSSASVLAMIANGADNETLSQLEAVLGCDKDTLNRGMLSFFASAATSDDCKMENSNSIWIKEGEIFVRDEFLQANKDYFDSDVYLAAFDSSTRDDINKWAKEKTDGLIDQILDEELDPSTLVCLINALLFDAKWDEKYEKNDIIDGTFTGYDGTESSVSMMCSNEDRYFEDELACGFAKYYKGKNYSFVALLPNEGVDIYEYLETLDGEKWESIMQSESSQSLFVQIPEFKIEMKHELVPIHESMGLTDLFDASCADLSRVNNDGKPLFVGDFYQKTYIEVNRNGTKAAAVTFGGLNSAGMPPKEIYLDRPFVFAIVDEATNLPLFLGVVADMT